MFFSKFVGGATIQCAIQNIKRTPYMPIFDYAREASKSKNDTHNYVYRISQDIPYMYGGLALKYSSFNCEKSMRYIIKTAQLNPNIHAIYLDAECNSYHEREQILYDKLLRIFNRDRVYLYKTYQMYRKDSMDILLSDMNNMNYPNLGIKLVRGAYLLRDQNKGVLFSTKAETDYHYDLACKHIIAYLNLNNNEKNKTIKLLIATHNKKTISGFHNHNHANIAYAQLLGMSDELSQVLYKRGSKVYKYVPYGTYTDLYPYLLRRLYENSNIMKYMF